MTGLKKQTNPKWAIDLIAQVPVQKVNKRIVSSDYFLNVYLIISEEIVGLWIRIRIHFPCLIRIRICIQYADPGRQH